MRRILRLMAAGGAAATLVACLLGWLVARQDAAPATEGVIVASSGPSSMSVIHAALGLLSAAAACVVAAISFLLGLHGLLETDGRRMRALALFCIGPVLMGLGLWSVISGWRAGSESALIVQGGPGHGIPGIAFAVASLAALAASLLVSNDRPDGSEEA